MSAEAGWQFTAHACTACLGRVMQCGSTFRCADCEREVEGKPDGICGCGINPKRKGSDGRPLMRCVSNDDRSKFPSAIVIKFGTTVLLPAAE